jgi:hypothetical protein
LQHDVGFGFQLFAVNQRSHHGENLRIKDEISNTWVYQAKGYISLSYSGEFDKVCDNRQTECTKRQAAVKKRKILSGGENSQKTSSADWTINIFGCKIKHSM